MGNPKTEKPPSQETVQSLLESIKPDSDLISISLAEGNYSNYTHIVEAGDPDGGIYKIVIRRYAVFGNYDRGEKARREYMALKFAHENDIPAPEPLLLDEEGSMLGSPGIVTAYVEGKHDLNPADPEKWAKLLARTLAKIHSLSCKIPINSFILDANKEASWFLRDGEPPDFMKAYPQGIETWQAANHIYPRLRPVAAAVVHIDYWPGNILWREGDISAVLDWEEAAYGDPIIDVAYAIMEMWIMGLPQAADMFLNEYESITGKKTDNLLFWELAAAARPMFSPDTWDIVDSPRRDRFDEFVGKVLSNFADRRL